MKKTAKGFLGLLAGLSLISVSLIGCKTIEVKNWNDDAVAHYADYFNKLCKEYGYTAFWWDTNTLVNREPVYKRKGFRKIQTYSCRNVIVNSIMKNYPEEEYNYSKTTKGFIEEDAATAVYNMKAGFNLGWCFDATTYDWKKDGTSERGSFASKNWYNENNVYIFETAWGMPYTTPELFTYLKEQGFNAVRIPITWAEHMSSTGYVDNVFMKRVHEVVDYVLDSGMYCIINSQNDNWICANDFVYEKYNQRFAGLWKQIANEFKNYDERLLFAGMNEVVDEVDSRVPLIDAYKVVNKWNQLFIDTVRATGGNNAKRNLIISPKGSIGSERNTEFLNLITDSVENHLIVEVHNYNPPEFCLDEDYTTEITSVWDSYDYQYLLERDFATYSRWQARLGLPIIISEYGAVPKIIPENEGLKQLDIYRQTEGTK